ncbi:hypothetical protein MARA_14900 [Mycolicibacterium arabiense]|uniref:Uncharacterized protein n=1 Tax=Mycolicibacterium arabiense TaxID=1286181 RepID=A0A7I7RTT1_9MYCO|nr:hypothetical protein MARA_14900 [Mycolicibacterium arabiense]
MPSRPISTKAASDGLPIHPTHDPGPRATDDRMRGEGLLSALDAWRRYGFVDHIVASSVCGTRLDRADTG